ncbi:MAG: CoA pyrophosphatase [Actinobacteria bacterium]|nr:CoA pyrophosphatase [Actinomycetota bacterium]
MVGHQRRNNTMRVGGSQVIPRPNNYRTIDHNPFTNLDTRALRSLDAVSAAVKAFKPDQILRQPLENARPSAVLVGLFETSRGVEAILTRRSQEMTNHRGEISFPGGRLDAGETVVDAALRETHEEIGLLPSDARVVGELNGMATVVSNSHIVPIVAWTRYYLRAADAHRVISALVTNHWRPTLAAQLPYPQSSARPEFDLVAPLRAPMTPMRKLIFSSLGLVLQSSSPQPTASHGQLRLVNCDQRPSSCSSSSTQ